MTVYRVLRASDIVIADTDGQVSTYDKADDRWEPREPGGGTGLPEGGSDGQLLSYDAGTSSAQWVDPPVSLPSGGTAGQVLTKEPDGSAVWQAAPGGTWDADTLAIARGFYEVLSSTEPTQTTYTASNSQTYPVVWVKPLEVLVPVVPEAPVWDDAQGTVLVPDLVGVDYKITSTTKDASTAPRDILIPGGSVFDVETATGLVVPFEVTVEAFAEPGYTLPNTYSWTHTLTDPNAATVVTSETFTGLADGASLAGRSTDAALGGTSMAWTAATDNDGAWVGDSGQATHQLATSGRYLARLPVSAESVRVTFDLVEFVAPSTGTAAGFNLKAGGRAFRFQSGDIRGAYQDTANAWQHVALYTGLAPAGTYVLEVSPTTLYLTAPGQSRTSITMTNPKAIATTPVIEFEVAGGSAAKPDFKATIDNIKVEQIGA